MRIVNKGREKVLIKPSPERKLSSSSLACIPLVITKHYAINYVILCFLIPASSSGFVYIFVLLFASLEKGCVWKEEMNFSAEWSVYLKDFDL